MSGATNRRPLIAAGTLIGIGMGGFVDGIAFHQILQLHNMLSAVRPPVDLVSVEVNMVWDGLFHALTWTMTALGIALLWRAGERPDVPWSRRTFLGALPLGWGLFNLVEGIVDHYVLGVHHVYEKQGRSIWDAAFVASGVFLIASGWALVRSGRRDGAKSPGGRTPAP